MLGTVVACVILLVVLVLALARRGGLAEPALAALLAKVDPDGTAKVDLYSHRGEEVVYVEPSGFDMLSAVYRLNGETLGAPSGGISGHGDGRLPDWNDKARYVRTLRPKKGQ